MPVNLVIPPLGNRFVDYRDEIPGDSYGWGLPIITTNIKYFTFHHSVTKQTAKNDGNWKQECNVIANEHILPVEQGGRGWGGVGYRFIICSNGVVAYVGDLEASGSAVGDHNDITFSACMVGDFTKELPTDAQIHSAHDLADFFINKMPQYPNLKTWDQIIGHKDFAVIFNQPQWATACPGSSWPNDMKSRIKDNVPYTPIPPQPPIPIPEPPGIPPLDYKKGLEEVKIILDKYKII